MECGEFPTRKNAGFAKSKNQKFHCFDPSHVLPFLSFNIDASALTNVVEFSTLFPFPLEVAGRGGAKASAIKVQARKWSTLFFFSSLFSHVPQPSQNQTNSHINPLFICGAADRSGRGKRFSCCCWGGDHFQSPMYSFLGCEKAKTV